ncbi:hypothetical protein [Deinococcus sp. QL22]|uniref:phage NrS-1 polymerase family protein n=1 Tax=Deinococcus sp. QL22 TaxID=2939437 RepID=UPI002016E6F8|nr:hypothetical protein [Deinococcus sp. QL22]UQN06512.1 hypothetical protein M1R55_00920 [Deinococcus sp. QL22]
MRGRLPSAHRAKTAFPLHRLDHLQATLPTELLELQTWLPWLALPRGNGKISKVPSLPRHGVLRPVDCRGAGLPLAEAHALACGHAAGGVGVVLSGEVGLAALDLDTPLSSAAQAVLAGVPGYAERSPGGGVHLWLRGNVPSNSRRAGIEVLGQGFITATGDGMPARGRDLGDLADVLVRLSTPAMSARSQAVATTLKDAEVLRRLYAAANGDRARRLLEAGDWPGLGYPSPSEGDMAGVRLLRFYTSDAGQIRRLMQGTALRREKWSQGAYLERTIARALELGGPTWVRGAGPGTQLLTG